MQRKITLALAIVAALCTSSGGVAKRPKDAWFVSRSSDPITGRTSCVVAAPDQFGSFKYSRTGSLYPIVELNSDLGLLVGVSSGGTYRLPTGDIQWRVDSNPFRELRAIDNPPGYLPRMQPQTTGNPEVDKLSQSSFANSMKMVSAMMATSTVASGSKAEEIIAEMLAGHSLIYRQASQAASYGLPNANVYRLGRVIEGKLEPIPIDESFHRGLEACGIKVTAKVVSTP